MPTIAEMQHAIPDTPRILTTTVGSYPIPSWLAACPTEESLVDAIRVVLETQYQAGIDLATDGELYRFDVDHPDTNGMIDYFVRPLGGVRSQVGYSDWHDFRQKSEMEFRARPAGVVEDTLSEGSLNLPAACDRIARLARGPFKFTLTSPYMLARTLLDRTYGDLESLSLALADLLAHQVQHLSAPCVQIDEANVTGRPQDGPIASRAINRVLKDVKGQKAVHFCFGNYGGQTIQKGDWRSLIEFLNSLEADHLVLELAHRPEDDLDALRAIQPEIDIGAGVVDVKINQIETPDEIARSIERIESRLGPGRLRWVHPDCGLWMLKRSVANRKIEALVRGRDLYLGI